MERENAEELYGDDSEADAWDLHVDFPENDYNDEDDYDEDGVDNGDDEDYKEVKESKSWMFFHYQKYVWVIILKETQAARLQTGFLFGQEVKLL